MQNIKPLSDHVLIEPIEEETITKSGIIIPETVEKDRPTEGKILAIGPGKLDDGGKRIPMSVSVNDTVIFETYNPHKIKDNAKDYYIIEESNILAIVGEEQKGPATQAKEFIEKQDK